ncbi:MAG: hypothetical protein AABZ02_10660 [Bacteroidota bacterium]
MTAGFYFVAFVDLLGQREKLSQFKGVPRTNEDKDAFFQAMSETGAVVRNVRTSVAEWLANNKHVSEDALANLPPERRDEFTNVRTLEAFQTGFSDCFTVAFPLQVDGVDERLSRARAVVDAWNALLGLSALSLLSLAQGIPWRAGVDVGIGVEILPNEVYGPALLSAYTLESRMAEYPRILVGRGLVDYLNFIEHLSPAEPLDAYAARMATRSKEFICTSDDGWPMLHMLSPAVLKASANLVAAKREAHQWVREQHAQFWSRNDEKLYRRYARLSHYFDAFAATPETS